MTTQLQGTADRLANEWCMGTLCKQCYASRRVNKDSTVTLVPQIYLATMQATLEEKLNPKECSSALYTRLQSLTELFRLYFQKEHGKTNPTENSRSLPD